MKAALSRQAALLQRQATDPGASVWVAASAGTGKTKVLTDRVLGLLLAGTPPERLLCLTFTKAAAAEMANRVYERLGEWATAASEADLESGEGGIAALLGRAPDAETRERARQLFARVLEVPGGLKIQTIHSFCQSLLARFPLEAGVAPHFEVMDERTAAELLAAARDEVLARAVPGGRGADAALAEALAEVSAVTHGDAFSRLMEELTGERARLRRLLIRLGGIAGVRERVFAAAGCPPEGEEAILAGACAEGAFDGAGLRRAAAALGAGSGRERARAGAIAAWLAAPPEERARPRLWNAYLGGFLTQKGEPFAKLANKAVEEAAPGTGATLAREAERLVAVEARRKARLTAAASAALLALGAAVADAYERMKGSRALLDYDDLILTTRRLFEQPGVAPWVLYKLDGGLDHVLIDEAQDTNPEQWQVVSALVEEFFAGEGAREEARSVFAVGDAKQSIFSFQRADPAEFERMRAHFAARVEAAGRAWRPLSLTLSFRSTRAVLEAVDAVFADPRAADGVALDGRPIRHRCEREGQAGLVELWPPAPPPEAPALKPWEPPLASHAALSAEARLARVIAARLRRWLDGGERLEARDRPLHPGDVMVLVRRRTAFVDELVRALKLLAVPVAGVDRMVLTDQLAVMDLIALGRFLLLPEDDLTLAGVLRSPLVGIGEEELFRLCRDRGEASLWERLAGLRGAGAAFARAHDLLATLLRRVDFVSPFELYAEVLGALGGRHALLARLGPDAGDPVDEFLELALAYERANVPSLQGFLHWLEAGRAEIKRDLDQGLRDEVRVMTVHGAKGLQAPVVFLPDTLQIPDPRVELLWLGRDDVALWPPRVAFEVPASAAARAQARLRREQEYRRLLYVAMTRAEDRLYVAGWQGRKPEPDGCWYRLIERAMARLPGAERARFDFAEDAGAAPSGEGAGAAGWQGEGWRYALAQGAPARADRRFPAPLREAGPLPDWARQPAPPEERPSRPLAPSAPAAEEPAPRSPVGEDDGAPVLRGRLVHRLLQVLPELAPGAREGAARRFLALSAHGLSRARQDEIAGEVLAVLAHPDFAALFAPGSLSEVPIVGRVGGQAIAGQVDRLRVDGDRILIVDYKTGRAPPGRPEEVPEAYLRQLAAYRAALAGVYPGRPVACALVWTDGPCLMEIPPSLLAPYAP
ncbi:MAG: double-strand break repair helicase AddA [Proteobacteria bacterium]|nr:double-strand break repair helicase AddA [Pseudomonadota bacterium]